MLAPVEIDHAELANLEGGAQWFDAKPAPDDEAPDDGEGNWSLENQQVVCLAVVVYTEAQGQPLEGQVAVGDVVMNRAERAGQTPCDVAADPGQFAGYEARPLPGAIAWKSPAFREALLVGQAVMWNRSAMPPELRRDDQTKGATCFFAPSGAPTVKKHGVDIGAHRFYSCL